MCRTTGDVVVVVTVTVTMTTARYGTIILPQRQFHTMIRVLMEVGKVVIIVVVVMVVVVVAAIGFIMTVVAVTTSAVVVVVVVVVLVVIVVAAVVTSIITAGASITQFHVGTLLGATSGGCAGGNWSSSGAVD